MDFQHRVGHKTGSGGPATAQEIALDRKERLRRLALETVDLSKDPYLHRNHVGKIECRLCLTLHLNEASYLTHTQGRKHQTNLARRAAKEQANAGGGASVVPMPPMAAPVPQMPTIGRPGYRVTKLRDPSTKQYGLRFEIHFKDSSSKPRHRFMSTWEQKVEPTDSNFQYVVFAAQPYDTIAFRIPTKDIEKNEEKYLVHWDPDSRLYLVQFLLRDR
ncbi:splicing factor 3a subunit 2, partial [Gregarina niphandrodes]